MSFIVVFEAFGVRLIGQPIFIVKPSNLEADILYECTIGTNIRLVSALRSSKKPIHFWKPFCFWMTRTAIIIGERECLCLRRSTYHTCFYVTLNLRVCMQYFTTLIIVYTMYRRCLSQRVVPCIYVLVFVLTASATSQHNTQQQVGVRINTAPQ